MKLLYRCTYAVTPVPWERVALFRGRLITPVMTRKYEKEVGRLAKIHMDSLGLEPFNEPLQVDLLFRLKPSDRFRKRRLPDVVCDIDNLVKSTLDGMNKIVWKDDRRIVNIYATKRWNVGKPSGNFTITVWGGITE